MYRYMQSLRYPLTLRVMMIEPVRTGYIGEDQKLTPTVALPAPVMKTGSTPTSVRLAATSGACLYA